MPATPSPAELSPPPPDSEPVSDESPSSGGRIYEAGDIIAQKYKLIRELGKGGMGAVWLARNVKLDVDVAIKLIRHELGTAEASERLLQEARAAARIGHRSIVRVFDFGETELDDPFIVMEVLAGDSLRQVLERKGRLPAAHAVRALLPIASALVEAHAAGVVHRDLKPENIMLVAKSGGVVPKLLDFGIAKFRRADDHPNDEDSRSRLVVGTPDYMSPEQAGGQDEVDEVADVWALAVILYEAITGSVPFSGPTYGALIFAIMTEEPTPTHELLAGDAELWAIILRALAKRDVDRPNMRAFGVDLARWAIARGIDSDLAGTSLAAAWLQEASASPFSEAPPPVSEDPLSGDFVIPRPAPLPGWRETEIPPQPEDASQSGRMVPLDEGRGAPVEERPAPSAPRSRGLAWAAVAVLAAGVVAFVAGRGREPVAVQVAGAASAPGLLPTASASAPSAQPEPAGSAPPMIAATSDEASAAPVSSATAAASASSGRPFGKRPWRKGNLPIAKQPNF